MWKAEALPIRLNRVDDDVVLIVEDTGVGIPEEAIPFIFDRFFRVDKRAPVWRAAAGSVCPLCMTW